MTVQLNRAYGGYAAGTVAVFDKPTETALIAQGIAVDSTAAPSSGTQAPQSILQGRGTIPIGAANLVVNHPLCTPQSVVVAVVSQAAADGTLLRVERVVPGDKTFTIYGTAAATAATVVSWFLSNVTGQARV